VVGRAAKRTTAGFIVRTLSSRKRFGGAHCSASFYAHASCHSRLTFIFCAFMLHFCCFSSTKTTLAIRPSSHVSVLTIYLSYLPTSFPCNASRLAPFPAPP
jgi:hypothetical protein